MPGVDPLTLSSANSGCKVQQPAVLGFRPGSRAPELPSANGLSPDHPPRELVSYRLLQIVGPDPENKPLTPCRRRRCRQARARLPAAPAGGGLNLFSSRPPAAPQHHPPASWRRRRRFAAAEAPAPSGQEQSCEVARGSEGRSVLSLGLGAVPGRLCVTALRPQGDIGMPSPLAPGQRRLGRGTDPTSHVLPDVPGDTGHRRWARVSYQCSRPRLATRRCITHALHAATKGGAGDNKPASGTQTATTHPPPEKGAIMASNENNTLLMMGI